MNFSISFSDVIAAVALLLSVYATWKTLGLNESQKRLNDFLLKQGESQELDARKADLGATFLNLGNNRHRLKIWNKGKAAARNVNITFPEGTDVLIESDINAKFPLEVLEQHQSVELIAAPHMGTKQKQTIRLTWDDDFSSENEKTLYPTL